MFIKVSTTIPAYNCEKTIGQTIDSALSQRFDGHEIIVVNDGSTDSTSSILAGYGDRIRIVAQANRGPSAARNAGIAFSTGKYLAFLDSDDIWLPGKLAIMTAALERNPKASLAFSEYSLVDENCIEYRKSCFGEEAAVRELLRKRPVPFSLLPEYIYPSTWVVPREIFERTGGFSEAFKGPGYEDSWMLMVLRELGEFVYIPERLVLYRVAHPAESADKYGPGVSIFIDLLKKRYGRQAKVLIRGVKKGQCRSLLSKVAYQMNRRDRLGALHTLLRIATLQPGYFFTSEFIARLRLPQNRQRLRDLAAVRPGTHS